MTKIIKYILLAVIICFSIYNSVYIESLTERKKEQKSTAFNAKDFAENFMISEVKKSPAIQASNFFTGIFSKDLKKYCVLRGKSLGISDDYNFVIQGNATVIAVEDENVLVTLDANKNQTIRIATDFIFGNTIRDATGIANIGDFQNTMDFNNISIELNNIVRERVVPPFKEKVKEGDHLYFKGAIKINIKHPDFESLKVTPLIINFK